MVDGVLGMIRSVQSDKRYHSGNREIPRSSDNGIRHGPATRTPVDQFVVVRPAAGRLLLAVERREARCDIAQEVRFALQSYR